MSRKKKPADGAALDGIGTATSVAEPEASQHPSGEVPAWVDGPQAVADAPADGPTNPAAKNWGPPYKAIFTSTHHGFEMGEDRRFKQRVFKFADKPTDEVLAKLKEAGFVYRGKEKAWTIPANPDTRKLSDDMARQFAGQTEGMSR